MLKSVDIDGLANGEFVTVRDGMLKVVVMKSTNGLTVKFYVSGEKVSETTLQAKTVDQMFDEVYGDLI